MCLVFIKLADKYVPLVEKENGLSPLRDLISDDTTSVLPSPSESSIIQSDVIKYAKITLDNVAEFNRSGSVDKSNFMVG